MMWDINSAGIETSGMSLFVPLSMTRIDKPGSASANLPATTHPAVPPVEKVIQCDLKYEERGFYYRRR